MTMSCQACGNGQTMSDPIVVLPLGYHEIEIYHGPERSYAYDHSLPFLCNLDQEDIANLAYQMSVIAMTMKKIDERRR